eukprot:TRINITY_DN8951_c1_g1_i1.p1 TRINITY_DN8951_c1_g1~~TRINITY_DN8951_c1_g1_i1.p1  ORF type:complete len:414 (+),score=46.19 TRINITY_DN8951_c1_g1_i1:173-1414(+)
MPAKKKGICSGTPRAAKHAKVTVVERDEPAVGLLSLPAELLEMAAQRLPAASVCRLATCHSALRSVVLSDAIWRVLYARDFPCGRQSAGSIGWFLCYKRAMLAVPRKNSHEFNVAPRCIFDRASIADFCIDRNRQRAIVLAEYHNPGMAGLFREFNSPYVTVYRLLAYRLRAERQPRAAASGDWMDLVRRLMIDEPADECLILRGDEPLQLVVTDTMNLQVLRRVFLRNWNINRSMDPKSTDCLAAGGRFYSLNCENLAEVGVFCTKTGNKLFSMASGLERGSKLCSLTMDSLGRLVVDGSLAGNRIGPFVLRLSQTDGSSTDGFTSEIVSDAYSGVNGRGPAFSPDGWLAVFDQVSAKGNCQRAHAVKVTDTSGNIVATWACSDNSAVFDVQWCDDGLVVRLYGQLLVVQPR